MGADRLLINKAGWKRFASGHPWLFKDGLTSPPDEGDGEILPLFDNQGHFLGRGFYNPHSRIAFRLITREDCPVGPAFWKERIETAIRYRKTSPPDSTARRLIYSEADGFPGLIVDAYGDCLSLQFLTLGMEKIRDLIIALLQAECAPRAMVIRSDSPVRKLEGLEPEKGVINGELPERLQIREGDLDFTVDLLEGQKTGAYLDQRDNRLFLRPFAKGKRVLDAFSYDGWFGLHLAHAGAAEVLALDSSEQALARLKENAALNGITNITAKRVNCFDALRDLDNDGERFDLIVLDPPPFARRRADIGQALRAYRQLNTRAIQCLKPGGLLFTCCCSHGVTQDRYAATVSAAAGKARRQLILMAQRLQPADHPILFNEPESLYLKALLFRCL